MWYESAGFLSTLLLYQILEDMEAERWWLIIPKAAPSSISTPSFILCFIIQKWFLARSFLNVCFTNI